MPDEHQRRQLTANIEIYDKELMMFDMKWRCATHYNNANGNHIICFLSIIIILLAYLSTYENRNHNSAWYKVYCLLILLWTVAPRFCTLMFFHAIYIYIVILCVMHNQNARRRWAQIKKPIESMMMCSEPIIH